MDENLIYLVQTDTIAGFLSRDARKLAKVKKRPLNKPFLINADSFKTQKEIARTPKKFKKFVRRAKRSTFIYPNRKAVRVVFDERFKKFLENFKWLYSTSANESGKEFDFNFAFENADIIVEGAEGFKSENASRIYKLSKNRMKKIR